jgi:hypothetical protein
MVPEGKVDAQAILTQLIERGSRVVVDPEEEKYADGLDEGNGERNTIGSKLEEENFVERQHRWDSLLEERLQSTVSITDWVERVLEVSDLGYTGDESHYDHSSSMENGRVSSADQMPQEGSDEESEQETGEHETSERNSSSDDMDSEINQHNGKSETSNHQTMNIDSATKTTVKELSYEYQTTGATNLDTDDRGQFDDASTSSDDSVDLRANKH